MPTGVYMRTDKSYKYPIKKELLEELYIRKGLSTWEIARQLNISSHQDVLGQLKRHNIPIRSLSEAWKLREKKYPHPMKGKHYSIEVRQRMSKARTGKGLVERVTINCKYCRKEIELLPSRAKRRQYCSRECMFNNRRGKPGHPLDDATRKKVSKARKGMTFTKEHRENLRKSHKGAFGSSAKMWKNPEYVKKMIESRNMSPNKKELRLDAILQTHFPNEFGYNGDFRLGILIGGLIPDFVNINGKKQLIELFGDYWHDDTKRDMDWKYTEFGRKAFFSQLGYDNLIIWECELDNEEKLIEKLNEFVRGD